MDVDPAGYEALGKATLAAIASVIGYLAYQKVRADKRKDSVNSFLDNEQAAISQASERVYEILQKEINRMDANYRECNEERALLSRKVDRLEQIVLRDHPESGPGLL